MLAIELSCFNILSLRTFLSPACSRRPWSGDYKTPSVRLSIRLCVRWSHFYTNLNILLIYNNIFTKFAGNVYGYENLSVQNDGLILKNKMAVIAKLSTRPLSCPEFI